VKAGMLETGDIFIVNKSDKPDADAACHQLTMMLQMRNHSDQEAWVPKVLKTAALGKMGVETLARTFLSHFEFMKTKGLLVQKEKKLARAYFKSLLTDLTLEKILQFMEDSTDFRHALEKIEAREMDPMTAAQQMADKLVVF
jgi:LAO/AO transport system kinase